MRVLRNKMRTQHDYAYLLILDSSVSKMAECLRLTQEPYG